jgi:hypothetical protein
MNRPPPRSTFTRTPQEDYEQHVMTALGGPAVFLLHSEAEEAGDDDEGDIRHMP